MVAQATDTDWWSPQQLAARWRTSPATIHRRRKLPAKNPQHIKVMTTGTKQIRIHISEILRHEQPNKSISPRQQETIIQPPGKSGQSGSSLLSKRMEALQRARQGEPVVG